MSPRISRQRRIDEQAARVTELLRPLAKMKGARPAEKMKEAAAEVVRMRSLFEWEGMPDWGRRSQECVDAMYRVYRTAGVPSDSESGFQANLRYHIGNVLREMAPVEELEALGLDVAGPRARAVRTRHEGPRPRPVMQPPSPAEVATPLELAGYALKALRAIDPAADGAGLEPTLRKIIDQSISLITSLPAAR